MYKPGDLFERHETCSSLHRQREKKRKTTRFPRRKYAPQGAYSQHFLGGIMKEKQLVGEARRKSFGTNILIALRILFDLLAQLGAVYLVSGLITKTVTMKRLLLVLGGILFLYLIKGICNYAATKKAHETAYNALTQLRLNIIRHLKKLPLGFFQEHPSGELTNIVEHDVEQVETYLAHALPEIMSATLLPLLIFMGMFFLDWRLALAMLLGLPLMFLVKKLSAKSWAMGFKIYFDHENKMKNELMEYVHNIAVIKAFGKEEDKSKQALKTAKEYVYWIKKSMGAFTIPMGLIDIFMESGVLLVMILGSIFLFRGGITIPRFILSIILATGFTAAIGKTATLQHSKIVFKEAMHHISKILDVSIPEETTKEKRTKPGDISFNSVNFNYPGKGFELKDINLHLPEKSLTALVGPSGCGKSTLANLLMGFWQPRKGSILIRGKAVGTLSQETLASLIASVQQEVILFNTSILENIRLGKPGASLEEIREAARKARIHHVIEQLPQGYGTQIGEMGAKLSGGEKQRISMARMILKDAPILVMDEAMAGVDGENERLIQEALEELRENKTVLTIAHHLRTIRDSDQIVVMNEGKILDTGIHEELLSRCEFYRKMVEAQNKVDVWMLKEAKA